MKNFHAQKTFTFDEFKKLSRLDKLAKLTPKEDTDGEEESRIDEC